MENLEAKMKELEEKKWKIEREIEELKDKIHEITDSYWLVYISDYHSCGILNILAINRTSEENLISYLNKEKEEYEESGCECVDYSYKQITEEQFKICREFSNIYSAYQIIKNEEIVPKEIKMELKRIADELKHSSEHCLCTWDGIYVECVRV